MIYEMIKGLAAAGKAVLLVDQNIKRALEIADYVYVMRTGTVLSEGSRDAFGGDTEALSHAEGEAAGPALGDVAQPDQFDDLVDPFAWQALGLREHE